MVRALRRHGDEAQFTQVIAALAGTEREFAGAFVQILLDEAKQAQPEKVAQLEPIPEKISCRAESGIRDEHDLVGRVDLRFDGADFALFVENKLHSGYGEHQVKRYLDALGALPPERARAGLLAVTRDIPGYGEPPTTTQRWLGSVRWARLLPQMLKLPLPEPLGSEWRRLLKVMHEDGDLGVTKPDTAAIEAWALHRSGREELEKLLLQIRDGTLGALREAMAARYPDMSEEELTDHHTFGKRGKVPVKHALTRSWIGFRIPASERRDPGLVVQFSNDLRTPRFTVWAEPYDAEDLLNERATDFVEASRRLLASPGFTRERSYWAHVHEADEWLRQSDVPETLAALAAADIRIIVASGIFDLDVAESQSKPRGLRRWRRGNDRSEGD